MVRLKRNQQNLIFNLNNKIKDRKKRRPNNKISKRNKLKVTRIKNQREIKKEKRIMMRKMMIKTKTLLIHKRRRKNIMKMETMLVLNMRKNINQYYLNLN
jgi:hypothetical protein